MASVRAKVTRVIPSSSGSRKESPLAPDMAGMPGIRPAWTRIAAMPV
jgi:hypothetical protein